MSIIIVPKRVKQRIWDRVDRDRREGRLPQPRDVPDDWKAFPEAYLIWPMLDATELPEPPLPIEVEDVV